MSPHRSRSTAGLLAGAVALSALLTGCFPGSIPAPPGSSSSPSSSPTPEATDPVPATPTPEADPAPTATAAPAPAPAPAPPTTLSAADRANLRDAISSGNTAAIEGYLADPVIVIIMASECCWEQTPADAVAQLSYVTSAPGPWNFALPAATVAEWRTNFYYGQWFTGDDLVGRAADGTIVSFGIDGTRVTKILMGFEEGFSH